MAPRTQMTGEGSYTELVRDLGVTDLRYPGGSLTEEYFDLSNPDAVTATGNETAETVDFIALSDFMAAAERLGSAATIVIPTRMQLSNRLDANNDRLPEIDVEVLRGFIRDVTTGVYGNAQIAAFEIGNEYWGSGRMNTAEYGRLAAEMTGIIRDEMRLVEEGLSEDIDIVVQAGWNFDHAKLSNDYVGVPAGAVIADLNARYDLGLSESDLGASGLPNWAKISNDLMISYFEGEGGQAPDGVVTHLYSKGQEVESQRSFMLRMIEKTWGQSFDDLDIYITEWNSSGSSALLDDDEDYGLFQAHEMLEIVEEFMLAGVDVAHAWPLLQNSPNALSMGRSHDAISPAGEMFAIMASSLPGKTMLDFAPDSRETEQELGYLDLHAFYGDSDLVLFLTSTSDQLETSRVDLSALVLGAETITGQVLGVASGQLPGSNSAQAELMALAVDAFYDDGVMEAALGPGEVMQITLSGIEPSAEFAALIPGLGAAIVPAVEAASATVSSQAPADGAPEYDDRIRGTDQSEKIKSFQGDDTVFGAGGNDTLIGGRGEDLLKGGKGADRLRGNEGDDTLSGGNAKDKLIGGHGDDRLYGGHGADGLRGGQGRDTLYGGTGNDKLHGGQGGDLLIGGSGANQITTGFGRDTIRVNDGGMAFEDLIFDFTVGRDTLQIESDVIEDLDALIFEASADELILVLGDSKTVVFEGDYTADDLLEQGSIELFG
ncbi:calcium-binding protein [Salipiger sp. 1_MG-2023]|uniref:calcium-binding protein n=1 Tax=Salipiger sp. 1_MG-2023 TaxID=3062665 RepID=UPI0026E478F2|nr:calcium-binding protein [Salipiger sp. 1_MG-2023]MDO6587805.1 calcium-binding protein [Salipiger sp. 1_MG-2023]